MATNRQKRMRTRNRYPVPDWVFEFLLQGKTSFNKWIFLRRGRLQYPGYEPYQVDVSAQEIWDQHKERLLKEWRKEHPNKKCWAEQNLKIRRIEK